MQLKNQIEIHNFLDVYHFPKLNENQISNLKRPITPSEIKTVIKTLLTQKKPGPENFSIGFYQNFKNSKIVSQN